MALLYFESFEFGNSAWRPATDVINHMQVVNNTAPKDGIYALYVFAGAANAPQVTYYRTTGSPTELYAGAWYRPSSAGRVTCGPALSLDDGNDVYVLMSSGTVSVSIDNIGTVLSVAGAFPNDTTYAHLELYYSMNNTTGNVEVWVDGVSIGSFTGDTLPGSATYIDKVNIWKGLQDYYCDNLYVATTRQGPLNCITMRPTSDSETTWTKSTGSTSYTLVDEAPANTTDYIYTATDAIQEEWGTAGNFTDTNRDIKAVVVSAHALGVDGTENIKLGIDSGGTESTSAAKAMVSSWHSGYQEIFETDPATAAAWANAAAVNAVKPYVESDTA